MYFKVLDHGSPLAMRAASFAVSFLLFLAVAAPVLAVGARMVS